MPVFDTLLAAITPHMGSMSDLMSSVNPAGGLINKRNAAIGNRDMCAACYNLLFRKSLLEGLCASGLEVRGLDVFFTKAYGLDLLTYESSVDSYCMGTTIIYFIYSNSLYSLWLLT